MPLDAILAVQIKQWLDQYQKGFLTRFVTLTMLAAMGRAGNRSPRRCPSNDVCYCFRNAVPG